MTFVRHLQVRQLDDELEPYRELTKHGHPRTGWIREIRKAVGMTARQLGKKMGTEQAAVTLLEQGEARGAITVASLRKAAEALDCDFVYALVPRQRLEERLRQRLYQIAGEKVARVSHTMALENQSVAEDYKQRQIEDLVQQMMVKPPRNLWG